LHNTTLSHNQEHSYKNQTVQHLNLKG